MSARKPGVQGVRRELLNRVATCPWHSGFHRPPSDRIVDLRLCFYESGRDGSDAPKTIIDPKGMKPGCSDLRFFIFI